jgi:hypothetical protein
MDYKSMLEQHKKAYLLTLGNIDILHKQLDEQRARAEQHKGAAELLESIVAAAAKEEKS